jgi:hypothetical protein
MSTKMHHFNQLSGAAKIQLASFAILTRKIASKVASVPTWLFFDWLGICA